MQTLLAALIVAFLVAMMIVRLQRFHVNFSADWPAGVQKFHRQPVPRIGGIAVLAGVAVALAWSAWRGFVQWPALWLLIAAVPVVIVGLAEDITKRAGVRVRLAAAVVSAGLGIVLLGAQLPRLGVPGLDLLMAWAPLGVVITLVAVAGVVHAVNIVDGFNGLVAAASIQMFGAFGYVAWALGDVFLLQVCLAAMGALLGFFFWNYPRGLVFLGDGGAYLVGFLLGQVAVLLVVRHAEVSPWFCLLVCGYPVTETLFSIYRKRWLRGMSPGVPDALHLHMLVYRRLLRWAAGPAAARDFVARNAATAPYLWALTSLSVIPAVLFWRYEGLLMACALGFAVLYVIVYARLVRFRSPRWLRGRIGG